MECNVLCAVRVSERVRELWKWEEGFMGVSERLTWTTHLLLLFSIYYIKKIYLIK